MSFPILETERLLLRPFRLDDFDAYAELCSDPEVMRYLSGASLSRPEAWRHMAFIVGHWHLRGYASEGARAALAHAFTALGKDHVISLILPGNQNSIRVAERLGERLEGNAEVMGKQCLVYGIGREEWTGSRP